MRRALLLAVALLAACTRSDRAPVAPTVKALGTEPFWAVTAAAGTLAWTAPEEPVARPVAARSVRQPGGWKFHATLDGQPFVLEVQTAPCSDGMSDRTYPLVARVAKGGRSYSGCANYAP